MKPSWFHYLLAHTLGISAGIGVLGSIALLLQILRDSGTLIMDTATITWSLVAAVPMAAMGWVFGVAFIWKILALPVARVQGWPYQIGDEVCILTGKHIHKITRIYGIWDVRGELRLELGDEASKATEDVFSVVEVCRMKRKRSNLS